jgi:hypothetical protein
MFDCHYIRIQLERIRQAGIGAGHGLSSGGSTQLQEHLDMMESAISRIRDEIWSRASLI